MTMKGLDDFVGVRKTTLVRSLAGMLLLAACSGCQTARSFDQGCPGVYSGLRYYGEQIGDLPLDGKFFFTLDVPFSAILDTLVLPGTLFAKPRKPPLGWPQGCHWAAN